MDEHALDDRQGGPVSNIPEFTVSEVSGAIKRTLEGAFARIRVRGEVTEAKLYASGHTYFALKDERGKLRAVVWKTALTRIGLRPENGVEVIATGRITAYGDRSEYQLVVERIEYAGIGALLARVEALRVKLAAEGLFDAARKRPLPKLPALIGVITSASGAVLHDIQTTIARRFARPILLWPVPVQGEGAAQKIAAAIAGMDRLPAYGLPRPDILIVARGGGSLEDLMAFNEEVVLRAAAACRLPLISAVGHETDTTLIDFVSDRRAPTPTAAAEMVLPARIELLADLAHTGARLIAGLGRLTEERAARLNAAGARLPDLPSIVGNTRHRLNDRAQRLTLTLPNLLAARRANLATAAMGLPNLPAIVGHARHRLDDRAQRLSLAPPNLLAARHASLATASTRLPDLPSIVGQTRYRLQDRAARLALALPTILATRRAALVAAERHIPEPGILIAARRHALAMLGVRARSGAQRASQYARQQAAGVLPRLNASSITTRLRDQSHRLAVLGARLDGASYASVLARGFALIRHGGQPVTAAASVRPGMRLALVFSDGEAGATADRPLGRGVSTGKQEVLF